jgi:SAM-dependent methyltransferase
VLRRLTRRVPFFRGTEQFSHDEAQSYWASRTSDTGPTNQPTNYLTPRRGTGRSEFLAELLTEHGTTPDAKILEVGCNVGRNLQVLWEHGFRLLTGIEINPAAIETMGREYPDMAAAADIQLGSAETVLPTMSTGFDTVFTMAVLVHLHPDSDPVVHPNIARICNRLLVTIEAEEFVSERHFSRNYRHVFEPLGFRQVEQVPCGPLDIGLETYVARVFIRAD